MAGVDGVLHVASPLPAAEPKDRDEVIRPAVDGTLRVLRAATDAGVSRVVVTSSAAACTPVSTGEVTWDEDLWTDPDQPGLTAYRASKVLAERAAWDVVRDVPGTPELVTVLPGAIFGPPRPGTSRSSVEIVERMLAGRMPAVLRVEVGIVDVRDLVDLELAALTSPDAAGRRYLGADEVMTLPQVAALLRDGLGARGRTVPRVAMPDVVARGLVRFVPEMGAMVPMLGRHIVMPNARARDELGWRPRPARETLLDTADALLG